MSSNECVALVHFGIQQPSALYLAKQLEKSGYRVRNYEPDELINNHSSESVVVVNVHSTDEEHDMDSLLDHLAENQMDIIINDTAITNDLVGWNKNRWIRHILHKIDSAHELYPNTDVVDTKSSKQLDLKALGIEKVWLLAASIGGPESLIKFLSKFDGSEPILFVIVQHMDAEFVQMMANQLNKNGKIPVALPQVGEKIKPGHAILVPVNESLVVESDGSVAVKDVNPNRVTTPCIDDVCLDMIEQLKQPNMAVFSGMASDGIKGAENVHENGGAVITQSADSCVLSVIADGVRNKNYSQFDGDPEAMAQYIKEQF